MATYYYYEKVHRTMRTAIVSYLLKGALLGLRQNYEKCFSFHLKIYFRSEGI